MAAVKMQKLIRWVITSCGIPFHSDESTEAKVCRCTEKEQITLLPYLMDNGSLLRNIESKVNLQRRKNII